MVTYSGIIQPVVRQIPNALLILGLMMVYFLALYLYSSRAVFTELLPTEGWVMLIWLLYMFISGLLTSPSVSRHLSQAVTSAEYMGLMAVIMILIEKKKSFNSFVLMILLSALVQAIALLINPVNLGNGRYSIAESVNPNGLGMTFALGIWASLFFYSGKKLPALVTIVFVVLLGYCSFLTGSRKVFIATVLLLVLWLCFCYLPGLKRENVIKAIAKFIGIIVVLVVLLSLFLREYSDSILAERMLRLKYEITEGTRSNMYRAGFLLFKEKPVFGYGFQGFRAFYGTYSHATLVEVPVCGGIIGTAIYFIPYYISIRKCIKLWMLTRKDKELVREAETIKMLLILWAMMLFYCTCIIHPYQFDSFIIFGIIFGTNRFLEAKMGISMTGKKSAVADMGAEGGKRFVSFYVKG